jgi:UDP-N-acetylglucosamine 4,6-dehydratase
VTTWLVTGASGSFGTAFLRTALAYRWCDRIVGISRNATMRYALEAKLADDPRATVIPGDVRILADLHQVLEAAGPVDLIVHAAAEKHVSAGQKFRDYVYDVNVRGAMHVLQAAQAHRVPRLIALSTDKACEPVNYYGETKRLAERAFLEADPDEGTRCTVVRYGNVAASSGSVIPLFIRQRQSGRLTVTDLRATRFFMPLADPPFAEVELYEEPGRSPVMSAVGLVKYAIDHGAGGEVFVPSIPSGTIVNLAQEIGPDCAIVETGLRDGEKLHEKLIADDELSRTYRLTEGVYGVLPRPLVHSAPVELGFRYTSDADPQPIHLGEAVLA